MARIVATFFNCVYDKNNYNIMPSWYESFFEGLRKAGNELLLFPLMEFRKEYGEISIAIKEKILEFDPDLCISFNNVFYDLSFLDCPILIYESDSPIYWKNKNRLIENKDRYLYALANDEGIELLQSSMGIKKGRILKARPFTSVTRDDKAILSFNISFIGTRFGVSRNTEIGSLENESPVIRDEYARCLNYIYANPYATTEDVILKNSVQSDCIKQKLDIPGILMMLSSEKRVRVLSAIVDLGLQLYGTRTWMSKYHFDSRINAAFVDKKVYSLRDNQDIYNQSKIGINISHIQTKGLPWRVLDIMASNACLVNDGWSGVKDMFKDLPIPIYYDEHEARSVCKDILKDDNRRESIVRLCNEYVDKNFRFNMLLEELIYFTGVKLDNYDKKGMIKIVDYSTLY